MDEIDQAQIISEQHLERSLAAIVGAKNFSPLQSFTECDDCGEEIPDERRSFMRINNIPCTRCVACQTSYEEETRW